MNSSFPHQFDSLNNPDQIRVNNVSVMREACICKGIYFGNNQTWTWGKTKAEHNKKAQTWHDHTHDTLSGPGYKSVHMTYDDIHGGVMNCSGEWNTLLAAATTKVIFFSVTLTVIGSPTVWLRIIFWYPCAALNYIWPLQYLNPVEIIIYFSGCKYTI